MSWQALSAAVAAPVPTGRLVGALRCVGAACLRPRRGRVTSLTGIADEPSATYQGAVGKSSGDGGNRQSIGLGTTHIISWILVNPANPDAVCGQENQGREAAIQHVSWRMGLPHCSPPQKSIPLT